VCRRSSSTRTPFTRTAYVPVAACIDTEERLKAGLALSRRNKSRIVGRTCDRQFVYKVHLLFGIPKVELVKLAKEQDIDLVVMGSRGLNAVKRYALPAKPIHVQSLRRHLVEQRSELAEHVPMQSGAGKRERVLRAQPRMPRSDHSEQGQTGALIGDRQRIFFRSGPRSIDPYRFALHSSLFV